MRGANRETHFWDKKKAVWIFCLRSFEAPTQKQARFQKVKKSIFNFILKQQNSLKTSTQSKR